MRPVLFAKLIILLTSAFVCLALCGITFCIMMDEKNNWMCCVIRNYLRLLKNGTATSVIVDSVCNSPAVPGLSFTRVQLLTNESISHQGDHWCHFRQKRMDIPEDLTRVHFSTKARNTELRNVKAALHLQLNFPNNWSADQIHPQIFSGEGMEAIL